MKKIIKSLSQLSVLLVVLFLTSCQEEFEEIGGGEEEQTAIEVGSSTALLIENTSSNDGSYDNIVDGSSCIAVQFPYTVEVAGIQITIDSIADLKVIEELFDEVDDDEDILEFIFPITIILSDFTEVEIENKEALRELAADCIEGGDDDDIECIDFVYPITLFTFDVQNQQSGSVTVNSDREMRLFFKEKEAGELVSIDYPITLEKKDGTTVEITNNAQLAVTLRAAKDECDEDDDDDYNDDDFEDNKFIGYLIDCPWKLKEIKRNALNQTEQYFASSFDFKEDNLVVFTGGAGNTTNGEWSVDFTENGPVVVMNFTNYTDFSLSWRVYELEDGVIKFFSDNDNKIVLERNCSGESNCNVNAIAEVLGTCNWQIADASWDTDFDGIINFSNFNIHAYTEAGAFVDEGNWEVTTTGQIQFNALLSAQLENMLGAWNVVDCGDGRVKLMNEGGAYVVLEKDCELTLPTQDNFMALLVECEWIVDGMKAQGQEIENYLGNAFDFSQEGTMTFDVGAEVASAGEWTIGYNNAGELSLMLSALAEVDFNYEWAVDVLETNYLKLKVEEIGYELELVRVCAEDADSDILEIRNIMQGGQWNVTQYLENNTDRTAEFESLDFDFSANNDLAVSINNDPQRTGVWRSFRGYNGDLRVFFNLGIDETRYYLLTKAWYLTELSTERFKLVYEDEGMVRVVVFEKKA
ncbi:hypothetical protein BUL40_12250 [Croceivirga radicis]|uniref:Lipocalin-like domain-containing protein n=1 Tax=Croceivirga radicis TaxID=1929488 RepID=A0A1V6LPT6_9FLAO|nr:hypothetical protein [Croceivirga radicis]OQD42182.1 hypothetical protein BUL40_12250 [Croceivirga radicis]